MATSSPLINKSLRRYVVPVLKSAGFEKVDQRNAWSWHPDCIWVFNIRAVGNYFSEGTGWPPSSVSVMLGVFYTFIPFPTERLALKLDALGRALPAEHLCHMRSYLPRAFPQEDRTYRLSRPAERARTDLWWLDCDGTNAEEVATAIGGSILRTALPWFHRRTDLHAVLEAVERERDCFRKFALAAYLARQVGASELHTKYVFLAEQEGRRIGRVPDRKRWFDSVDCLGLVVAADSL